VPLNMASSSKPKSFQAPTGTRDLYPEDALRQRYITDVWRRVSLRHGFDEIGGPTFEHSDLYAVKSGEGILNELFQAYSGKSPDEIAQVRETGRAPFALRPEFTPTLARMYAARANQLPKPVRWFSVCNYFRAERPQRGRLREFLQWNADCLCGDRFEDEVSSLACLSDCLEQFGLAPSDANIRISNRLVVDDILRFCGVPSARFAETHRLLDQRPKLQDAQFIDRAQSLGLDVRTFDFAAAQLGQAVANRDATPSQTRYKRGLPRMTPQELVALVREVFPHQKTVEFGDEEILQFFAHPTTDARVEERVESQQNYNLADPIRLTDVLALDGLSSWCAFDFSIVRGLAYYTGTVFEAIAEGERAVAGGGRYDNLIELLGGPPTPACGFAMGDVVLGNLLDDKGLMPTGAEMLEALSRPMPVRPDAFVISANEETSEHIVPLVARLRRGELARDAPERKPWDDARYGVPPLHARRSYKSTRNVGKLLKEASQHHARFAVIIESPETASIKDLDANAQTSKPVPLDRVAGAIAQRNLGEYL